MYIPPTSLYLLHSSLFQEYCQLLRQSVRVPLFTGYEPCALSAQNHSWNLESKSPNLPLTLLNWSPQQLVVFNSIFDFSTFFPRFCPIPLASRSERFHRERNFEGFPNVSAFLKSVQYSPRYSNFCLKTRSKQNQFRVRAISHLSTRFLFVPDRNFKGFPIVQELRKSVQYSSRYSQFSKTDFFAFYPPTISLISRVLHLGS